MEIIDAIQMRWVRRSILPKRLRTTAILEHSGPEVGCGEVCGIHESGRSHLVLLRWRVDAAAQNPFRRYLCKCLNLRTQKLGLSATRKQVLLGILGGDC
jgi:hypothetical protein